jgi:hypothetical protein
MLYLQADGINRAFETYHDLIARGRLDDANAFFRANKDQIAQHALIAKVEEQETLLNRQIRRIGESPDLTAGQKQQQIIRYNAMRNKAAESVFGQRP